jgi:hypothetical protein
MTFAELGLDPDPISLVSRGIVKRHQELLWQPHYPTWTAFLFLSNKSGKRKKNLVHGKIRVAGDMA